MKLFDVDVFKENVRTGDVIARDGKVYIPVGVVNKALEAAKAGELIRCRECENWKKAKVSKEGHLICPKTKMKILVRTYCSSGERKAE